VRIRRSEQGVGCAGSTGSELEIGDLKTMYVLFQDGE
jgi:hypothetical protein